MLDMVFYCAISFSCIVCKRQIPHRQIILRYRRHQSRLSFVLSIPPYIPAPTLIMSIVVQWLKQRVRIKILIKLLITNFSFRIADDTLHNGVICGIFFFLNFNKTISRTIRTDLFCHFLLVV